jgi:hypothetical protein
MGTRGPKKRLLQHHPLPTNALQALQASIGYDELWFGCLVCIIRGTGSGTV